MAHLSTVTNEEPRESPVWFTWEAPSLWIFGTENDSFIKRLRKEPRCAMGIVEFDLIQGILKHVGIRGRSIIHSLDPDRRNRFISKYLWNNKDNWNRWFVENLVDPLDSMVQIVPASIIT